MYRRLSFFVLVLLLSLTVATIAQEKGNAAEKAADKKMAMEAAANSSTEPHMSAALRYLLQAEEELEKANAQHGGYRAAAWQNVESAEANVVKGIQYFNSHVPHRSKQKK